MIVFIVPVKSKQLTKDWDSFSNLVQRTLGSICQQTDNNFEVMVVCHELPKIEFNNNKLHFIHVDFDPPKLVEGEIELNNSLKERDKALKIQLGISKAVKFSPDYFMVVDSDDCISNRIVKYVNSQDSNLPGWYMKKGYFYREGQYFAYLNKQTFNMFCGTSLIINANYINKVFIHKPIIGYNHQINPSSIGLITFPFPATIYSMENGENHYMSSEKIQGLLGEPKKSIMNMLRSLVSKAKKYRPQILTSRFKKRYNYYSI